MMAENNSSVAKIVGSIVVDFSKTLESINALENKVKSLDKQFKELQNTVNDTAKVLQKSFNVRIQGIKIDSDKITKELSQATKSVNKDIQDTLLRLERGYTALLAKGEQLGVLPKMAEANLAQIRGLQEQLALGEELSKNDLARLKTLEKRLVRANYELDIVKQETEYYDRLRKVSREIGTPENRMLTALSRSISEAPATIEQLQSKLLTAQRNLVKYGLETIPEATKIASLQNELATLQQQFAVKKKISQADVDQYKEALKRLNIIQTETANLERNLGLKVKEKQLEIERARQAAIAQKQLEVEQRKALGPESFLERRFGWFIAGTGFFGSIEAIRQATATIQDVESGMVQISRVSNEVAGNFTAMRDKLIDLAYQYGMSWKDVQDIALRWAQAGYNIADTLKLTETSLMALNTAELDARYSTEGLIGIMSQWGLTAAQLPDLLDKINKVADDYTVTSQDLVDGLLRSSGAAKILGLSIEDTIAILTVMREATGRTGKEVGNALNSILSFIQRPKSLEAFAKEGIAVFTDATMTKFRNVKDIFTDIAAKWDSMSEASKDIFVDAAEEAGLYSEELADVVGLQKEFNDLQRRDISQAAAGIYRRNYLVALLQNWAKVDQVLLTMETAHGYSMKENARTMETLEKKVAQLRAALVELAVAVGDSGLLDFLKETVDLGKDVVNFFNSLPPAVKTVITHLTTAFLLLKTFELTRSTLARATAGSKATNITESVSKSVTDAAAMAVLLDATGKAITQIGESSVASATKISRLAGAFGLVGNAAKSLFALLGGWQGLIVTGILATAPSIYNTWKQHKKALDEQADAAAGVYKELEILQKVYGDNIEATSRYKQLVQEVAENLPQLITQYDEQGKAIAFNRQQLEQLASASQKLNETDIAGKYAQEINTLTKELSHLETQRKSLPELINYRNKLVSSLSAGKLSAEQAEKAKKDLILVDKQLTEIAKEVGVQNLKEALDTNKAKDIILNATDQKIQSIRELIKWYYNLQIEAKNTSIKEIEGRIAALKAWQQYLSGLTGTAKLEAETEAKSPPFLREILSRIRNWYIRMDPPGTHFEPSPEGFSPDPAEVARAIKAEEDKLRQAREELQSLRDSLNSTLVPPSTPGRGYVGYPETTKEAAKEAKKWIDSFRDALEKSVPANVLVNYYNLNDALQNTKNYIEELSKHEEALKDKIDAGNISRENYARLAYLVNERVRAYTVEQQRLEAVNASLNEQYSYYLQMLSIAEDKYNKAVSTSNVDAMYETAQAIKEVKDKLAELSNEMSSNNQAWFDMYVQIRKAKEELNAFIFETTSNKIETAIKQQKLSLESQLEVYKRLATIRQWDSKQYETLYENMAKTYSEIMQKEFDKVEKYYDEHLQTLEEKQKEYEDNIQKQIDAIEQSAKEQIDAIQKVLDALNEEEESDKRVKAREEHERKLAELMEERRYHELRTGIKHQKAIQDIDKQIDEENRRWAEQQAEWERQDQRERLQEQIDNIERQAEIQKEGLQKQLEQARESYEKQRKELEKNYKQMREIVNNEMLEILANMASHEERWFEIGKQLAEAMIQGIESGDWSRARNILDTVQGGITEYQQRGAEEVYNQINEAQSPRWIIYPGQYEMYGDKAIMWARALGNLTGTPVDWDPDTWQVIVNGRRLSPIKIEGDRAFVSVREFMDAIGRDTRWDSNTNQIYVYHTGGFVKETGPALVEKGEYVIPRATVASLNLNRNSTAAIVGIDGLNRIADRIIAAIFKRPVANFDKLVNIEQFIPEDKTDVEILSRDLARAVKLLS
jgi:hypothetical protein